MPAKYALLCMVFAVVVLFGCAVMVIATSPSAAPSTRVIDVEVVKRTAESTAESETQARR